MDREEMIYQMLAMTKDILERDMRRLDELEKQNLTLALKLGDAERSRPRLSMLESDADIQRQIVGRLQQESDEYRDRLESLERTVDLLMDAGGKVAVELVVLQSKLDQRQKEMVLTEERVERLYWKVADHLQDK